jgi:penicillin-binding protein 1A
MAYAHQGIEVKQLPGIPVPQVRQQPAVAELKSKSDEPAPPPRPALLTKRGADALVRVERLMDDANRALGPARPTVSSAKDKEAAVPQPENSDALASTLEGRAFGNHN